MKKLHLLLVLIPISIAFLIGCEKESELFSKRKNSVEIINIDGAAKAGSTMLSFTSSAAFDSVLLLLDSLYIAHDDNFLSQWGI